MSVIPDNLDARLRRSQTADALTAAGYPTANSTLATLATRGGGPRFQKFGKYPIYTWGDALDWAQSRLGPIVRSTSELDASNSAQKPSPLD